MAEFRKGIAIVANMNLEIIENRIQFLFSLKS